MTIQNCDVTKDSKTGKTKPPFVTSSSRNLTSSRPASSSRSNDFNGKRTPYMDRKVSSQVGVRPGSEGLVRSSRLQSHSTPSSKYVGASPSAATAGSFGSRKYLSSNPMTSSSYRTTSSVPTSSSTSSSKRPSFFRTAWKFWLWRHSAAHGTGNGKQAAPERKRGSHSRHQQTVQVTS